MKMHKVQLGDLVHDEISGFKGVVVGRCQYLTGCNQALVQPMSQLPLDKKPEAEWFDETRLDVTHDVAVMEKVARVVARVHELEIPGFDKEAPKV